jgi:hypothetical protein
VLIEDSDGKMTPSGHNWVQGQGAGPRLKGDADEEEEVRSKLQNQSSRSSTNEISRNSMLWATR